MIDSHVKRLGYSCFCADRGESYDIIYISWNFHYY